MLSKGKYQKQKDEIKKGIKAIWRQAKPFKAKLIILIALGLISSVANGFIPYITGRFFDAIFAISQNKIDIGWEGLPVWMILLGIWALVQFVANNIDWIIDRLRRNIRTVTHLSIQVDGFVHFLRLPLNYHKRVHINGELHKIGQAGWRVSSTLSTLIDLAPQFLSIFIGIILALSINAILASILLVGVLLYVIILIKILMPIVKIDSETHEAWNNSWNDAAAAVMQIESVKQAVAEDYEGTKVRSSLLDYTRSLQQKLENNWSDVGFFQRTLVFFTQLTVFILSVQMIATSVITVGELVAINGYAMMIFGPFVSLGYSWQVIQNGIISAAHAEEIFDSPQEIYNPKNSQYLALIEGDVTFKNVSFQYTPLQPIVLSAINFEVKSGEIVALVGESGVGKSTAVSLISGYYFPTEGEVFIDGVDTRKLDLNNLRKQIAVVPQEVALFNDTIKTNIRYGSFDASHDDVIRVAKEAYMEEFISALPEGYETLVGERGVKLSVGQKQRVSIARAMLRNPSILILDEPTSALDARTEKVITEALERLMKGRTTFIVAHRLSTVRRADKILVFQKGKIVEIGTHGELIKRKDGVYRHLYEYQVGLH